MTSELKNIIKNIIEENGCKLYDIEFTEENGYQYLRIYITKNGGVSLNDCVAINNLISPILDIEEPIDGKYFLEVSSPGIERKLSKKEHFENSIGENIKITLNDGTKIKGVLKDVINNEIIIGEKKIQFKNIKKAKTYVEWNTYKLNS